MKNLNLTADIIPAHSAGGFTLGQNLIDLEYEKTKHKFWNPQENSLRDAISSANDFIIINRADFSNQEGTKICFSNGAVELNFNAAGTLYQIMVFSGYKGLFLNRFGIGTTMHEIQATFKLLFDDGDDMYYPENTNELNGIAFYADESGNIAIETPFIAGISIHNWSLT